ncbi:carboxypeptidase-like regulatory domain-containing protein [Microbacterium horticulturae]|uniref:Carboxypeptidase-like regulatory domain-containing protein n=1 Tax=Microbacterium horticulturae TaxID=3028316 RepID=A0ABY8C0Z8_9MICO|nr:carboxypeptidase-like regulatory domain-containing protein [Microbacterium sp. KACC 23027]WEG10124.1 carboxypeptidase-like regulatory domain-containing protein [Microbacterium sp. KACC 23027]
MVVAMLIFAIVMTGFLYTVTASLVTTRDTRARVVAANLAAQQIDLARSAASVFSVNNHTLDPISLNGDTFHVSVKTSWVTDSGSTASCEAGEASGSLSYKQVTVEVTWDNMRDGAQPVRSDTAITPKTKINNPTLGTVLVGVVNAAGTAVSGATVSLSPSNGVASVATDSDGCAYLLKVPADTYTVTASKSGYIAFSNGLQTESPTATVPVTAGSSSRISFAMDQAATFMASYAPDASNDPDIPKNLTTTFLSTYGNFSLTATSSNTPQSYLLYPFSSGYSVIAGAYVESGADSSVPSCLAPDPSQWIAADGTVGARPAPVGGIPGSTVDVSVPMGVVSFSSANSGDRRGRDNYLTAVYVGTGDGDPGCQKGMAYSFEDVISSNSATIALPYGTWELYRGKAVGSKETLIRSGNFTVRTGGSAANGVIVLDPRATE